jgi:tetratricopeptide (TPR) repeat protein
MMFNHDMLDWNLSRLARRLQEEEATPELRLAFANAQIAKARFHGGDDALYTEALNQARRVLHHEPGHPEALVVAALALVLLDRAEAAERYLQEARRLADDNPRLHMALGEAAMQRGAWDEAEAAYRACVKLAPESWEAHLLLGRLIAKRAAQAGPDTNPARDIEHAQYHLVRALSLGPSAHEEPAALFEVALLCLRTNKVADAQRLLTRLQTREGWRAQAWYHLGRVASRTGRYKKAILYFREHLSHAEEETAEVWSRIGACYLHEGEPARAREACHRALALDPYDVEARWYLGAALIAEGATADAIRVFREILELAPDHQEAFSELVRLRTLDQDLRWLRQAMRSETAVYDRLPVASWRHDPGKRADIPIDPRASTRARIQVLMRGLVRVDPDVATTMLECMDLTTDEGLRFVLWEGVLEMLARRKAESMTGALADPGVHFSAEAGRDVLTLAHLIDEDRLLAGLDIHVEDLKRAAVARHGAVDDVAALRQHIARERQSARAWQALLLLALASKRTATARNLLVRWTSDADDELRVPARAGLAMLGDTDAIAALRGIAAERQLEHLARLATRLVEGPSGPESAILVTDQDGLVCATCGRRGSQVAHMITGRGHAVCNVCMARAHERRPEIQTRDPELACALTGASLLDVEALYVYQGVPLSGAAIDMSVGHDEREFVLAWLATQ